MNIYKITSSETTDALVVAESISEASKKFINKMNEFRENSDLLTEDCIDLVEKVEPSLYVII